MIGKRLGPYKITGKLGEGGMGEVYRATDSKLRREVAIKVLPAAFTEDPERLARFEREAQLLAQLHHPNIASIFGLEESDGVQALVMELVEGPTLAERLEAGPLALDETLSIARQIAEALEEAHEKGIVHRDLKPQNVKSPLDSTVKVLDFGLAKAMDSTAEPSSLADLARSPTLLNSPTLTAVQGTAIGVILGTAAYMAPEQARGGRVDKRADIWAFGVVLYEMMVGRSLFSADTVTDTLAAVLKTEIDFTNLPASTPAALRRLLRRCLERNPKNRLRDIGEARLALDEMEHGEISSEGGIGTAAASSKTASATVASLWLPWTMAALFALIAISLAFRERNEIAPPVSRPQSAFGVLVPESFYLPRSDTPLVDLSADGRTLLFVAEGERSAVIFRRSFDRMALDRVEGSEGASQPVLSPDGRTIAYFAGGKLMKVDAEGGTPVVVAEARAPRGASWAPDGSLVFSPVFNSALWRVNATGGAPEALTRLDVAKEERTHRWPQVLPDGRAVIFTVGLMTSTSDYDDATIDAFRLDTGERRTILEGARMARYTAAGYLVYQRRRTLLAVPFDPIRLETTGESFVVQEEVGGDTGGGAGYFAVSDTGTLAFAPENAIPNERVLVLADRDGTETELAVSPANLHSPRFSPSGDRLAFTIGGGGMGDDDVFIYELASKRTQRLTFHQGRGFAIWSPDGHEVVFTALKDGGPGLAKKAANGSGEEVGIVTTRDGFYLPDEWLADGRIIVSDVELTLDIRLVDSANGIVTPLFASPSAAEYSAALSPNNRFIAYTSTQSAADEIFVETFPPGGGKWQVSIGGGISPVWSRDGSELFFVSGSTLMVAEVETEGDFGSGTPRPILTGPYDLSIAPERNYDVGPDGRFVLVKRKLVSTIPREIVVLDGWQGADPRRATLR